MDANLSEALNKLKKQKDETDKESQRLAEVIGRVQKTVDELESLGLISGNGKPTPKLKLKINSASVSKSTAKQASGVQTRKLHKRIKNIFKRSESKKVILNVMRELGICTSAELAKELRRRYPQAYKHQRLVNTACATCGQLKRMIDSGVPGLSRERDEQHPQKAYVYYYDPPVNEK